VTGKVGVLPNRPGGDRGFTGPSAADQDRRAAELDEDLRGTARYRVGGNRGPEHLDVPSGRRVRIIANDVDVIECERGIAHWFPSRMG
jgi:hypothetical protein